ncbi:uncharacterized protein LOC127087985 [Lathyrus oleraceus]|uniref:uncharacterized protein LOC127087985 n=1 Tax=Pisum sativum TaxID=3888 RepID=UPI0021D39EC4|nr:uncharacterized protein LOC127087985 [Pisum sativum]
MSPKLPFKFDSGYEKLKKKKKLNELNQSQARALDKFLTKEPQVVVENSNVDNVNLRNFEELVSSKTMEDNIDFDATKTNHLEYENVDNVNDKYEDIFDPRIWDSLESKRDLSIVKGPKDKLSRRFTANLYTRVLSNAEKCDRDSLVYSKEICIGQLTNEGLVIGHMLVKGLESTRQTWNMSKDMIMDVAIEKIKGLISFFERYRETGFNKALKYAKEIVIKLNIDSDTTFNIRTGPPNYLRRPCAEASSSIRV